jgi:predicted metal-dependent phosphoesterase TrpH
VVLSEDDVRRATADAVSVGRPHVADALVAAGVVTSRDEAFATWIGEGKPGHVSKPAPSLLAALATVTGAGGVCVLAHPWGRGSRHVLDEAALADLARAGLSGLEVDHIDHDEDDRAALRRVADDVGLVVTGGSDYHGLGKAGVPLGMFTTDEEAYRALRDHRLRPTALGRGP